MQKLNCISLYVGSIDKVAGEQGDVRVVVVTRQPAINYHLPNIQAHPIILIRAGHAWLFLRQRVIKKGLSDGVCNY